MWILRLIYSILGIFGIGQSKDWFLAAREDGNSLFILRSRKKKPEGIQPEDYPFSAKISWRYEDDGGGLPTDLEESRMKIFEEQLDSKIENKRVGYLMSITTGYAKREWNWYVNDSDKFHLELSEYLSEPDIYPIVWEYIEDKGWRNWETKIGEVKNKPPNF